MRFVLLSALAIVLSPVTMLVMGIVRRARDRSLVEDLLQKIVGTGATAHSTDRWNGLTARVAYGSHDGTSYYLSHIEASVTGKMPKWTYEAQLRLPDHRHVTARWTDRAYPGQLAHVLTRPAPPTQT